ncbi:MAG TPA: TolC family protein [Sulfuricurvum sp.]|nr:TolC family protein [Sulfuricurvum sp.]
MKTTIALLLLFMNAPALELSLDDAISMALQSHPESHLASLQYESAKTDSRAVHSALLPRIDLNGEYFPTKTFVMPVNGTFSTRQNDAFHTDVSGSYLLWDFGRSRTKHQAAASKEQEALTAHSQVENTLIEHVWLRYYTVAYLKRLIETADTSAQFYESQWKQAKQMHTAGLKTAADESRFQASWMEAHEHLEAARAEHQKALIALELLVGANEPVSIAEDFDRRVNEISANKEEAAQLREHLSLYNPQLQKLRISIEHAKLISEAADKESYGTLMLVGSYGYDRSLSAYDTASIGVRGTIPLYEGGKLSADAQKTRLALLMAQKEYENTERSLWQELYNAYSDLKRSDETIAAKAGVIAATQKALLLMEGRYAQGLATYIDVLESQSVLENARIAHEQAKFQKIAAWAQIQRLLNKRGTNDVCKN